MGQTDVLTWLKDKRLCGEERFYSIREIADALREPNQGVYRCVNRLYAFGFLEVDTSARFRRSFRARIEIILKEVAENA